MTQNKGNKITKNTIPEGFTVHMALTDLIPVVFFGLSAIKAGQIFHSTIFVAGAVICLLSGIVKVLWKLIAAVSQKNIWPMFLQMRIAMPLGFLVLLVALILDRRNLNGAAILSGLTGFPACIFFGVGILGMLAMFVFAFALDSADPKVNWMEQTVNALAQLCFFIGLMLV